MRNETNENGEKLVVNFRNKTQVILFEHELKGQISDGNWENASPNDHWILPCNATPKVGKILGRNFHTPRYYGFSSPSLLEVVGDRMRLYVKFSKAYPSLSLEQNHLIHIVDSSANPDTGIIDERDYYTKDDYWIKGIRALLKATGEKNLQEVGKKIAAIPFTHKDLVRELKDMNTIFRMHVSEGNKNVKEPVEVAPIKNEVVQLELGI